MRSIAIPLSAWRSKIKTGSATCGLVASLLLSGFSTAQASPVSFYTIASISSSTAGSDLFPVSQLIEGRGVGFDTMAPYNQLGTSKTWVTDRNCYPCNYFTSGNPTPALTLDLGQDRLLTEISVWGYRVKANSVSSFSLLFATDAEGIGGFGNSIAYNPTFAPASQDLTMQEFAFTQHVTGRYVKFVATANHYSAANPNAGGDRVGLGEIAFEAAVPEPGSLVLVGAGLLAVAACRRRPRASARLL